MGWLYRAIFPRWRPRAELRPTTASDRGAAVRIRWLGTAGHVIETATTTLLVDPFMSRPSLPRLAGRIAPEAEFDFIPMNSNDSTFQRNNIDAQFYRERGIFGARFIIPFGIGSFYARAMFGVDHIGGTTAITIAGARISTDYSSTGFTFEPGLGIQFNIVKHLVISFTTGFPIATHDFGNNRPHFTAVDVDFLAVVGFRM